MAHDGDNPSDSQRRSNKDGSQRPSVPAIQAPIASDEKSPSGSTQPEDNQAQLRSLPIEQLMGEQHQDEPPPDHAPPPYSESLGHIEDNNGELGGTNASVADDGRVNIRINQTAGRLSSFLHRAQHHDAKSEPTPPPPYIPPSLGGSPDATPPPRMNVVIHVVGSRGDVQPFVALGKVLKDTYGHRVRLATHPVFKDFVNENGLEFFSIGGDPAELMAFMVKNPGLMPGYDSLKNGDIGKRRKGIAELIRGCWRSCFEAGDGSGVAVTNNTVGEWMDQNDATAMSSEAAAAANLHPFVADCIIANPPSFAHIHCAERLGIPLHIMFTMPWSPTQAFPHPLANIQASNADVSITNTLTYTLVDMLTWQGLGDVINQFRVHYLGLEPVSLLWAPGMLSKAKIPHTYCWSPALIPKPTDWAPYISISGFFFLSLGSSYAPPDDLKAFLDAGPPPVYIGFGSIVVDDPNAMTKTIFEAVKLTGQRALVSKGWGGLGADQLGIPDGVFMLGNCPHDWLFKRVSCVVHHGGAGTTAAGIACGKPTVIVPFFGDQPWWGRMVAKAGAGPDPVPYAELTAQKLADSINFALKPSSLERAKELAEKISKEDGNQVGAQKFHQMLDVDKMRCSLLPNQPAVWRVKRTQIRLSAVAAYTLAAQEVLHYDDLKLYRPIEYEADTGPPDPALGGAAAIIGTFSAVAGGVADVPINSFKAFKRTEGKLRSRSKVNLESDDKEKSSSSKAPSQSGSGSRLTHHQSNASLASPGVWSPTTVASPRALTPQQSLAEIKPDDASSIADTTFSAGSPDSADTTRFGPTPSVNTMETRSDTGTFENAETTATDPNSEVTHLSVPDRPKARGRSMADAINSLSESSRPHSPNSSPRHSSPRAPTRDRSNSNAAYEKFVPDPLDTLYGTGKGITKIVGAGLKAPLDFTMALSKGFHNLPRAYGEEVRQVDKVTDFNSGLRTAGKEFGLGFYHGVSGLVTQPLKGGRDEGAKGFVKGFGRGIAGLILKPGAAIYGLPAYAMMGVYKEVQKHLGENVGSYIIAARVAQGYGEWLTTTEEERRSVVHSWAERLSEVKGKRGLGKEKEKSGSKSSTSLSKADGLSGMQAVKEFVDKRKEKRRLKFVRGNENATYGAAISALQPPVDGSGTSSPQSGRPDSKLAREHAASAALAGSSTHPSQGALAADGDSEDAELEEAIRLSMRVEPTIYEEDETEENLELRRAITASLDEMRAADEAGDDDEDMRLAIATSRQHEEELKREIETARLQEEEHWKRALEESKLAKTDVKDEHDEHLRKALEESKLAGMSEADDAELKRALEESQKEQDEAERARREEEIVLEYVKKASVAEQRFNARASEGQGREQEHGESSRG